MLQFSCSIIKNMIHFESYYCSSTLLLPLLSLNKDSSMLANDSSLLQELLLLMLPSMRSMIILNNIFSPSPTLIFDIGLTRNTWASRRTSKYSQTYGKFSNFYWKYAYSAGLLNLKGISNVTCHSHLCRKNIRS